MDHLEKLSKNDLHSYSNCPCIVKSSGLTPCPLIRLVFAWDISVWKFFNNFSVFEDNDTVAKAPGPFTSLQGRPLYGLFRPPQIRIGESLGLR